MFDPADIRYTAPDGSGNLDARYDYARIAREIDPHTIRADVDRSIWHYAPFLPAMLPLSMAPSPLRSLGWSPMYRAVNLERALGQRRIWLKACTALPSASFKDRASAMVIARAMQTGVTTLCAASTGNAAAALAALCAGNGLKAVIFVPKETPEGKLAQILIHGATVYQLDGSYTECVALATESAQRFGWYNRNTGTNPYTREGKKTAGFEIAEQLGDAVQPFRAPDVVVVPVGDGNIISGVWKGFFELHEVGWTSHIPMFIGATAALAPSLQQAFDRGSNQPMYVASKTIASGISVDVPEDGLAALQAVRGTAGALYACSDEAMLAAQRELAEQCGVFVEPACASVLPALRQAKAAGRIRPDHEVVLQLTGHGLKDPRNALRAAAKPIVIGSVDDIVDV